MSEAGESLSTIEQEEVVTPEELARQVNEVPNPTNNISNLIAEERKKPPSERKSEEQIATDYINNFKAEGHRLVSVDDAVRIVEPCLDCGEQVPVGYRSLVRVGNPGDIDIHHLGFGIVHTNIKSNPDEPIKSVSIPFLALHGMEKHGKYSMESRAWGQEQEKKAIDPKYIVDVLRDDPANPTSDK